MESSASPTIFALTLPHHSLFHHYPDAIKDWFEAQITAWIDAPAVRRQHNAAISVVVYNLIQSTYRVIHWEHVARAFQPEN